MTTEHDAKIFSVPPPGEDFSLWPYLDTLYRWCESQPWFAAEMPEAWRAFAKPGPTAPQTLPDPNDPDEYHRVFRFWAYFALDRFGDDGRRPIERFLAAHDKDLTDDGRAVYEDLTRTVFGAFRVSRVVSGRLATFESLHGEGRYTLTEKALTSELVRGDLVVGRLYPHGESYLADPDVHVGPMLEAPQGPIDAPTAEATYFASMVPPKGHALDVLDALLLQVDSPLNADDLPEMMREHANLDALLDELYQQPAFRLRYLHLRDRSLLDELMQELWDTAGPLQAANLSAEDAAALARTVKQGLRAIAEGDVAALEALSDPKGFLPLYLDLFGIRGLQRLTDTTNGPPGAGARASKHELLPKDGGILTTLSWGKDHDRHVAALTAYATPEGQWKLSDVSPPEGASPAVMRAYDRTTNLGWASAYPKDGVEALLRKAVEDVGYAVHDTIDLFRLWRDFKAATDPDMAQPAIWAAGVELADTRYRNEALDVKVLAKGYGVMPRAIEAAADAIDTALRKLDEAQG